MRHIRLLAIVAVVLAALVAVPFVIFRTRPPVLIVTDAPFAALYGSAHLRQQQADAARALFRQVKPVMIADGAGADVVSLAIREAAAQPLCVLFPRTQAAAALYFHEQFPEIPAVLLRGLASVPEIPSPDDSLYVYSTDNMTDLYRAGLFAAILGAIPQKPVQKTEKQVESAVVPPTSVPKTYVLWQNRSVQAAGRELFSQGVQEQDPESVIIFVNNGAEMPDMRGISCLVLTSAGAEYFEKNPRMPLILFSWLNPELAAQELMVLFDDSVWALAVPAVRMAALRQTEGKIPSKPLIFSEKIADNSVFRSLKKSAKKVP
ncbi:MAG: hypothetical protein LBH20_09930 [Treponema sp.]|jgi:hypothetical protein|nr:hypothetical protein [Treponema sp.]